MKDFVLSGVRDLVPVPAAAPLRVAVRLDDPILAARLTAALSGVTGLVLTADGDEADAVLGPPPRPEGEGGLPLTPREREVLRLVAEGSSNKVIARQLGISVHTAKFHVRSLIDKLDATGRTDAVAHAARIGVIHL